jgi:hypothetical protein
MLLVIGLFVVARGLNRGQPLLAPLRPDGEDDGSEDDDSTPAEDDARQ